MKLTDCYVFGKNLDLRSGLSPEKARAVCAQARARKTAARAVPLHDILDVLARAGQLFADPKSPWRKAAHAHLAKAVSFSEPVTTATLDMLPLALEKEGMKKRLSLELGAPYALDACSQVPGYDGLVAALPRGVALHVGAGNVFLGVVDSLVMGLLTKNVNIVKTAQGGSLFPVLFCQALRACDPGRLVCDNVAVLHWKGGDSAIESIMLDNCDTVLVWGGEKAVSAYKKAAPAHVRVAAFGPKISLAVATRAGVQRLGMGETARALAHDVCLWDQAACSCPHMLYFVDPSPAQARKAADSFLLHAGREFSIFQKAMPQGRLTPDEMVEITKARELAKVDQAVGEARLASSFPRTDWTVIAEYSPAFRPSPLNRVLYVKTARSLEEVAGHIAPHGRYLQTIGFAGTGEERREAAVLFGAAGAARITRLGRMLEAPAGSPHDGGYPMRELVNFVGVEGAPDAEEQLCALVRHAREKTAYYKKRYAGLPEVASLEDFRRLPLLDKNDILANTPPENEAMFSEKPGHGIYFASGGSTGSPKYIFYEFSEYALTARRLARCFTGPGLAPGDRAANMFVAGNLWSSFISVEKALPFTGAISVPLSSTLPLPTLIKYLEEFKVNAIIGLPSFLLRVAEAADAARPKPKIPLKFVFYGGEHAGPAMARYFRKVFPGVELKSAGYATVDAGPIGFQCPHCKKGEHHLFSGSQYLEVLDTATGRPAKPGATGELVTTPLDKRFMPVIRFKLGDLGRWLPGPCPCGAPEPRFELLGRCDDRIHLGGAHIFISDLETAFSSVPGLSLNFQAELRVRGPKDCLRLKVERKPGCKTGADQLAKALQRALRKHCEDLAYVLEHRWIEDPEIEILQPGALPRVSRTGKLKKVVDLRHSV